MSFGFLTAVALLVELQQEDGLCQALAYLADALAWAEPEGYIRTFVDRGPALIPLLHKAGQQGVTPAYVARLLAAFSEPSAPPLSQYPIPNPQYHMVEPLSARGLEVLHLLAAGKSNQEIGDTLFLAVGTVKKHLNNIFGKLGVTSRTQCVARARELGLIE